MGLKPSSGDGGGIELRSSSSRIRVGNGVLWRRYIKNPITRITAITKIGATKYNSVYVGPRLSGSEGLLVYCIIPPVDTVENKEQKFKYYRTSIEVTSHLRRCHLGKNLNVCWFH